MQGSHTKIVNSYIYVTIASTWYSFCLVWVKYAKVWLRAELFRTRRFHFVAYSPSGRVTDLQIYCDDFFERT